METNSTPSTSHQDPPADPPSIGQATPPVPESIYVDVEDLTSNERRIHGKMEEQNNLIRDQMVAFQEENAILKSDMRELLAQLRTAAATVDGLQAQVNNLSASSRAAPPQSNTYAPRVNLPAPAQTPKAKFIQPTPFGGKREDVDRFMGQIFLVDTANPLWSDDQRMGYLLGLCSEGTASPWASRFIKAQEAHIANSRLPKPARDYMDLKDQLRKTFGDPDPAQTAQKKIETIRQNSRSAEEYITEFLTNSVQTGYNDEALLRCFKRGLHPRLLRSCFAVYPLPTSFLEWQNVAIQQDRAFREMSAWTSGSDYRTPTQQRQQQAGRSTRPQQQSATKDPDAMDVDRAQTKGQGSRRQIKCFNCDKT